MFELYFKLLQILIFPLGTISTILMQISFFDFLYLKSPRQMWLTGLGSSSIYLIWRYFSKRVDVLKSDVWKTIESNPVHWLDTFPMQIMMFHVQNLGPVVLATSLEHSHDFHILQWLSFFPSDFFNLKCLVHFIFNPQCYCRHLIRDIALILINLVTRRKHGVRKGQVFVVFISTPNLVANIPKNRCFQIV